MKHGCVVAVGYPKRTASLERCNSTVIVNKDGNTIVNHRKSGDGVWAGACLSLDVELFSHANFDANKRGKRVCLAVSVAAILQGARNDYRALQGGEEEV